MLIGGRDDNDALQAIDDRPKQRAVTTSFPVAEEKVFSAMPVCAPTVIYDEPHVCIGDTALCAASASVGANGQTFDTQFPPVGS
jgi:hypothetical protein